MRDPVIVVFAMTHNEEFMMPYFMRHYNQIASEIIIYDNESTDRSTEIAFNMGATIRPFPTDGTYYESKLLQFKNTVYREVRGVADFAIVVDIDELLWCSGLKTYLRDLYLHGVTIPWVKGYDMMSRRSPTSKGQIYQEVKYGVHNPLYNKQCIFSPLIDINFTVGSHFAYPKGRCQRDDRQRLKLLHYRLLGYEYILNRWKIMESRLSDENRRNGWAVPPGHTSEKVEEMIDGIKHDTRIELVVNE